MNIGKWYDPLSERWIVPRQSHIIAAFERSSAEKVPEPRKTAETQRIWDLLVDCCAGG